MHQSHVGSSRRHKRHKFQLPGSHHQRMRRQYHGSMHPRRSRRQLAVSHRLSKQFHGLLIRVCIRSPDIHDVSAMIRNYIMLRPGIYHRHADLYRAKNFANPIRGEIPQSRDIFHRPVNGIYPLIACGMARLPFRHSVKYEKPPFSHGRLHSGRLPDNHHVGSQALLSKMRQKRPHTLLSHHLLCSRYRHKKIDRKVPTVHQVEKRGGKRPARRSSIGSAEAIEARSDTSDAPASLLPRP